mmetsp:Transcript_8925/g.25535  ORF Transcript_8925/g.25535 Transcript_8925/m.25535 type:complete len:89 (+) Transcript_8925:36-302(+)
MGLASGLVGVAIGVSVQTYTNALRKLPYLRHPYMHVFVGATCGYIGYKLPSWEEKLIQDINSIRIEKNMGPLERTGPLTGFGKWQDRE